MRYALPTLAVVLAFCSCAASIPVRRRDLARAAIRGRAEGQIALDVPAKFATGTAAWTNVKQRTKPTATATASPISIARPPGKLVTVPTSSAPTAPAATPVPAYWAGASVITSTELTVQAPRPTSSTLFKRQTASPCSTR